MKKKISILLLLLLILTSCSTSSNSNPLKQYSKVYYGPNSSIQVFDTAIQFIAYTKSEEEFDEYYEILGDEFLKYHKLFDRFNEYDGINNLKTINDNRGTKAVEVSDVLFDVIKFSVDNYKKTNGHNNIRLGAVSNLWQETMDSVAKYKVRQKDELEKDGTSVEDDDIEIPEDLFPTQEELEEAKNHSNIEDIVLDEDKKTVYIKDKDLIIDLGSVAKGYVTELVAKKLEDSGLTSGIISAGGNVRTIGKTQKENAKHWGIGIVDPRAKNQNDTIETLYVDETSVVTSGDYQRYFMANGNRYHHIIDPDTSKPADKFSSVTVVTENSGLADYLSTVLFIADEKEGREIISNYDEEINVLWVDLDKNVTYTDGLTSMMKSLGITNEITK